MRNAIWAGVLATTLVLGVGSGVEAAGLITGRQVKDGSVASVDVRNGSLASRDVRDSGLGPDDYDRDITGPAGPAGAPGPQGFPGIHEVTYRQEAVELNPGENAFEVNCANPNQFAIAGGLETGTQDLLVRASAPGGGAGTFARSWYVHLFAALQSPALRTAYVVCVSAPGDEVPDF